MRFGIVVEYLTSLLLLLRSILLYLPEFIQFVIEGYLIPFNKIGQIASEHLTNCTLV